MQNQMNGYRYACSSEKLPIPLCSFSSPLPGIFPTDDPEEPEPDVRVQVRGPVRHRQGDPEPVPGMPLQKVHRRRHGNGL